MAGSATLLLVFFAVIAVTTLQPRIYLASSRLEIMPEPAAIPLLGQRHIPAGDVFQLSEQILALDPLLAVVRDLNLPTQFARQYRSDAPLDPITSVQILRRNLEVRRIRLTHLVEIRSYSRDAALGAEVANRVAEEYLRRRAVSNPGHAIRVIDPALPGLRPVAPNLPRNLVIGLLPAIVMGLLTAVAAWWITRRSHHSPGPLKPHPG